MTTHFPPTERLPPINTNFSPIPSPSLSRRSSDSQHSPLLLTPQSTVSSSSPSSSNTTVLPPVSCITLPMSSLISPISTPSNGFQSPTHELLNFSSPPLVNTQLPSYATKRASIDSLPSFPYNDAFSASSYDQFSSSSAPHSNRITHAPLSNGNGPSHPTSRPQQQQQRHNPYAHPIYNTPILSLSHHQQQQSHPDPSNELLAEKRRRNAGASARFRDRRKQRERDMQERCQFLERRMQELENMDSAKRVSELEKKFEAAILDRNKAERKIKQLENEVQQLRNQLSEREYLTPSSMSSSGDSDNKEYDAQSPEQWSEQSERVMKPTDVKSLLL